MIDRSEAFKRLKIAEDRKLILSVGRLWPQKRYRDLIGQQNCWGHYATTRHT